MSWIAVGVAGATAVMGIMNAKQQAHQQKVQNLAAAAQTENSPWTGMGAGQIKMDAQSPLLAGAQGALGGYMQGRAINSASAANKLADQKAAADSTSQGLNNQLTQAKIDQIKQPMTDEERRKQMLMAQNGMAQV